MEPVSLPQSMNTPPFTVVLAQTPQDLKRSQWVRKQVFVQEQGVPEELELDGKDSESIVFLILDPKPQSPNQALATCRCRKVEGGVKVERFAVLKTYRGMGLGKRMMQSVLAYFPLDTVFLNAQKPVVSYYQNLGFEVCSQLFYEAGIPHYTMQYIK